jgi:hypothetical protein
LLAAGLVVSFFKVKCMHAFVPAVLLWLAWLDALDADAQPQSPHEEADPDSDPHGCCRLDKSLGISTGESSKWVIRIL